MYARALRADLEVPAEEPQAPAPPPRPVGKRTLTARLQPRGATARTRTTLGATGDGEPLPAALVRAVRGTLGEDVSGVRVHVDGQADALGVQAFAVGEAIHVAAGAYQPGSASGLALVGHEVAHVLQQRAGRVGEGERERGAGAEGTSDRGDVPVVIEPALEAEADQLGDTLAARAAAPTGEAFDLDAFLAGPGASSAPSAAAPVLQGKGAGGGGSGAAATGAGQATAGGASSSGTSSIPADAPAALARWSAGFDRFKRLFDWGCALVTEPDETEPSRETMFHNSCEWIRDRYTPAVLLAPVPAAQQSATNDRYFDDQLLFPATGPNLNRSSAGWGRSWGVTWRDKLYLIDLAHPEWTDDAIIGTVIHEVQHNADGGPGDELYRDGAGDLTNYKSEFRAAWIDPLGKDEQGRPFGDPRAPAPTGATVTARRGGRRETKPVVNFGNERQHRIFMNLVALPRAYGYVATGFVFEDAFRAAVTAYTRPVGGNTLNSVRVEELAGLITSADPFAAIEAYARTSLDSADRAFLTDKAASADFWAMAADHLPPRFLTRLEAAIRAGGGATAPTDGKYQYTVVAGDTLSLIAGRLLGDPMRYPDICALPENPQSIRDNPDLIEPGWTLWIPGA